MDSTNKILSFEEFVKQGQHGETSMDGHPEMMPTEVEPTGTDSIDQVGSGEEVPTTSSEPVAAEPPVTSDTDHNVPVHMMDDTTGEAEAQTGAEPNVSIEEPTSSEKK